MEEWKLTKIGTICKRVCSGGTPKSTVEKYYGGEIPWLNTKEVNFNRIYSTESTITEDGLKNSSAKWIDKNAVIVAMYGATAAKCAIGMIPMTTNQACCNLMIDEAKADYRFVYYSIVNSYSVLAGLANGGAQQNLNAQLIKDFAISLPSLETQKRIADILSTIDDKIENNTRINHNLEEQARIQFEAWCAKCVESKLIRELSSNILDYTPNNHKKVILLNSSDVTEGRFESLPFVDNQNLKGQFKKRFMKGDILYSEIRPRNHHFAICYFDADEYIASTRLMVIRKNEKEISSDALLYQYLLMPSVLEEFTSKTESRSGTFPQGNYDDLSSSKVPYSSDNLQIGKALDAIYGVIWANMEENKRLASIRDSLLPQLMSGLITC